MAISKKKTRRHVSNRRVLSIYRKRIIVESERSAQQADDNFPHTNAVRLSVFVHTFLKIAK